MWKVYALLSALFAALTAVLAKAGVKGIHGNVATAVRTLVVLIMAWGLVILSGQLSNLKGLSKSNWLFLIGSGVATGLSWIFYFRALETGDISKVAPIDKLSVALAMGLAFIFLKEPVELKVVIGGLLIVAGTLVIVW